MKICIVANNAYGALTGEESGHIGGVERQTALLSEWLVDNGHNISVITWDEGGQPIEYVNGLKIIKLCKVTDGIPILRFFTPRWTSLISALKEANADLYYHNCAEYVTGQVAFWAKANKKPFIYTVASDADCELDLPNLKSKREEYLFRYGLTHANLVITQTRKQQQLLQKNYEIDAQVINMPAMPPQYKENFKREALFTKQKVIWVGRLHKVKRVEWLIEIAEKLPEVNFEIIGPVDNTADHMVETLRRIKEAQNINYLGKVSRTDMPAIYQNASILCCTSIYEGFPNTYLEAWSYGVPVITTIDPDDIIKKEKLGYHAITINDFLIHIKTLLNNTDNWEQASLNSQNYYLHNHEQESVMKKFEQAFTTISTHQIDKHFDKQSERWSDYYNTNSTLSVAHIDLQQRLKYCQSMLSEIASQQQNTQLLELGCGSGDSFNTINKTGNWEIEGVDISLKMIEEARSEHPNINVQLADATALPFVENQFRAVVSLGVIEYIKDFPLVISEVNRVLEPNGSFIVSIPNKQSTFRLLRRLENILVKPLKKIYLLYKKQPYNSTIFHQQWSQEDFSKKLISQGFTIERIEYCTYALLSPKLEKSTFNIYLSKWLHKNLYTRIYLKRFLANTIIIHARVTK